MGSVEDELPLPPWRTKPKARVDRQPLSQQLIVDTAMRVLDAEGLDAVTMRRVAQELGTGPASLYAHVANKDELLELLLERASGEIELPAPIAAERWREQLTELCRCTWRMLTAHADLSGVALGQVPTGPNILRCAETMLAIMRAGGLSREVAALGLDRLVLYISSDAYEAALHVKQTPPGEDPQVHTQRYYDRAAAYYRSLPPERFPNIVAGIEAMMGPGAEERFEFGLALLIDGLAEHARRAAAD